MNAFTTGPFTGRHAAALLVAFFAVVIAVNVYMAREAIGTFGGVVVENSYVASQEYNGWLHEAAKEKALGWSAEAKRRSDGHLVVTLGGAPDDAVLSGDAWHPLGRLPDRPLKFARQADGTFVSVDALPQGRWVARLEARSGATRWRTEENVL
ncbi:MAG: FixH family protein [Sphingomonadales bacterium]|nr:FixH family protein [Sphingomonadales bacterium]